MEDKTAIHDLEPHQIANIYQEDDAPLEDVRENALRKVVYWIGALFVLMIVSGAVIKIPKTIRKEFVTKGGVEEYIFKFDEPIFIVEKFGKVADSVAAGRKLVTINSKGIARLIEDHRYAQRALSNFNSFSKNQLTKRTSRLEKEILRLSMHIIRKKEERRNHQGLGKLQIERAELDFEQKNREYVRDSILTIQKVISPSEYEKRQWKRDEAHLTLEMTMKSYQNTLQSLDYDIQNLDNEIVIKQHEIDEVQLNFKVDEEALKNKLNDALQVIEQTYGRFEFGTDGITLLSDASGVITYLSDTEKEIEANESLLKIKYQESMYYAITRLSPKEAPKVMVGNSTTLKFFAYPHYTWGTLPGVLESKSETPDDNGNYLARIHISDRKNFEDKLQKGLTGESVFLVDEKPLFGYIFERFKRTYYETTE